MPAISFISSATAILHQGCKAVFCDVNLDDYCMNIESLKNKITKNTKAIIPVHFAGSACNMKKISNIAKIQFKNHRRLFSSSWNKNI